MSTIATDVKRRTAKKEVAPSILSLVKSYFIKGRMAKAWNSRNLSHGDVFVETLEVESLLSY